MRSIFVNCHKHPSLAPCSVIAERGKRRRNGLMWAMNHRQLSNRDIREDRVVLGWVSWSFSLLSHHKTLSISSVPERKYLSEPSPFNRSNFSHELQLSAVIYFTNWLMLVAAQLSPSQLSELHPSLVCSCAKPQKKTVHRDLICSAHVRT